MADTKTKRLIVGLRDIVPDNGSRFFEEAADFIERADTALAEIAADHRPVILHDVKRCRVCVLTWPCATAAAIRRAREAKP